jgi:phosphoribosyl-AMP cyclohydrolase
MAMDKENNNQLDISKLKFNEKGLIPAIVQDEKSKDVLMIAYMNKESIQITLNEQRTCFYSRSRQKLWRKGETSGHIQKVKSIYYDCDGDALLVLVEQTGVACHTGRWSCFYRKLI